MTNGHIGQGQNETSGPTSMAKIQCVVLEELVSLEKETLLS